MFKAVCPHCSLEYTLDDSLLGKTANCKRCRNVFMLTQYQTPQSSRYTFIEDDSSFELQPNPIKIVQEEPRQQIPNPKIEKRF
jgi:hypothetical protein